MTGNVEPDHPAFTPIAETLDNTPAVKLIAALRAARTSEGINRIVRTVVDQLAAERDTARNRLAAVAALHPEPAPRLNGPLLCHECGNRWPCPTRQATQETT